MRSWLSLLKVKGVMGVLEGGDLAQVRLPVAAAYSTECRFGEAIGIIGKGSQQYFR